MKTVFYVDDSEEYLNATKKALKTLSSPAGLQRVDIDPHLITHCEVPEHVVMRMKGTDAVVLDYNWGLQNKGVKHNNVPKNGIQLAKKLRDEGYTKPIIIYSTEPEELIRMSNQDISINDLGLIFVYSEKKTEEDVKPLNDTLQSAFKKNALDVAQGVQTTAARPVQPTTDLPNH